MTKDFGLAIAKWAEKKCIVSHSPVFRYVAKMLDCGSTDAYQFCHEQLQKNGWKHIDDLTLPEDKKMYACEQLGDIIIICSVKNGGCFRFRNGTEERIYYVPEWWKERKDKMTGKKKIRKQLHFENQNKMRAAHFQCWPKILEKLEDGSYRIEGEEFIIETAIKVNNWWRTVEYFSKVDTYEKAIAIKDRFFELGEISQDELDKADKYLHRH